MQYAVCTDLRFIEEDGISLNLQYNQRGHHPHLASNNHHIKSTRSIPTPSLHHQNTGIIFCSTNNTEQLLFQLDETQYHYVWICHNYVGPKILITFSYDAQNYSSATVMLMINRNLKPVIEHSMKPDTCSHDIELTELRRTLLCTGKNSNCDMG